MSITSPKDIIAKRVALEFEDGMLVNLGRGIPLLVPKYLPKDYLVWCESENGVIGVGPAPEKGKENPFLTDAANMPATILPGGCTFDSAKSFGIVRGGHLDYSVLGTFQVDQEGNIANWTVPGEAYTGMGGAMDLVAGAKKIIVATEHCDKNGLSKILKKCTFPLTGIKCVDIIVTELAFMVVTEAGLELREVAPGISVEEVIAKTDAELIIPESVSEMPI